MLVKEASAVTDLLACPLCHGGLKHDPDGRLRCQTPDCQQHATPYERRRDKDVLIDFDNSVLDRETTLASDASSVVGRGRWRAVLSRVVDGTNPHAATFAKMMVEGVTKDAGDRAPVIVVVGAGEIGNGSEPLYQSPDAQIISFDIYATPDVTFVADAHAMPLRDGVADAIWIQGVLELVADPRQVVAEAVRVLKPGGLMFTDTAFMWPVCEQAYDFNRWTPSGLRWLFRHFDILAAGQSTGPGTMAVLAIRYLMQSLLRSSKLGQIAAFPFVWLRLLDKLCDDRRALDASVGMFLFGRKREQPIAIDELIAYYDQQPGLKKAMRSLGRDRAAQQALLTAPVR
jgi:SAM-dependent methyltransferase